MRMELLLLLLPLVAVVVGIVAALRVVPLHHQEPPPLSPDNAEHTIYSQVQRAEKPKDPPSLGPPPCTTIYAAATGPPPTPGRAPRALAQLPTLQGHPPLSQSPPKEPTTVYVGVMMPMA